MNTRPNPRAKLPIMDRDTRHQKPDDAPEPKAPRHLEASVSGAMKMEETRIWLETPCAGLWPRKRHHSQSARHPEGGATRKSASSLVDDRP